MNSKEITLVTLLALTLITGAVGAFAQNAAQPQPALAQGVPNPLEVGETADDTGENEVDETADETEENEVDKTADDTGENEVSETADGGPKGLDDEIQDDASIK